LTQRSRSGSILQQRSRPLAQILCLGEQSYCVTRAGTDKQYTSSSVLYHVCSLLYALSFRERTAGDVTGHAPGRLADTQRYALSVAAWRR